MARQKPSNATVGKKTDPASTYGFEKYVSAIVAFVLTPSAMSAARMSGYLFSEEARGLRVVSMLSTVAAMNSRGYVQK